MTYAETAAAQFTQRRAWLSREVREGRLTPDVADDRLRPWLHLAAIAGAQLDAVFEDGVTLFPFDRAGQPARLPMSLFLTADDRAAALDQLGRARDAAIHVSETQPDRTDQARALDQLARHLGAPPHNPSIQEAA